MKPFHPLITLAIFGCLLVPFGLSTIAPRLEPYPAIVLPGGGDQVPVAEKRLTCWQLKLWGKNEHDAWFELDTRAFLSPIPVWYLEGIANREFGFDTTPVEAIPLLHARTIARSMLNRDTIVLSRSQPSAAELSLTRAWLRTHLRNAGAAPSVLRVTIDKVVVEIPGGRVVTDIVLNERLYPLDAAS